MSSSVGRVDCNQDSPPPVCGSKELSPEQIAQAMSGILTSTAFRTSKQSQRLLTYLVEQALHGSDDMLKERVVGINVFQRSADYDTGDDPVVRVRAVDVRKRLAQYYTGEGAGSPFRIQLRPGSYHPLFALASPHQSTDPADAETATIPKPPSDLDLAPTDPVLRGDLSRTTIHRGAKTRYLLAATAIAVIGLLFVGTWDRMHESPIDLFWRPILNSPRPVLIYLGTNAVYRLSDEFVEKYHAEHNIAQEGQEFFVRFPPGTKIDASEFGSTNGYVLGNDVATAVKLISLLDQKHRPFELRWGHDISMGDLRQQSVILVGGFNNDLTLQTTSRLRFVFESGTRIRDKAEPKKTWTVVRDPKAGLIDDYAIVSRLLNPTSGAVLITVAGIGENGTQAAGDFLTDRDRIAQAVSKLTPGWDRKNLQILLHVKTVDSMSTSVEVISEYLW